MSPGQRISNEGCREEVKILREQRWKSSVWEAKFGKHSVMRISVLEPRISAFEPLYESFFPSRLEAD